MRKVLNVVANPKLGNVRRQVLESAGYEVVTAENIIDVMEACEAHNFDAVVIGHGIPEAEKRRITFSVRAYCKPRTPIIGVYLDTQDEVVGTDAAVSGLEPQKLIDELKKMLNRNAH